MYKKTRIIWQKLAKNNTPESRGVYHIIFGSYGNIDISAYGRVHAPLHCRGIKKLDHSLPHIPAGVDGLGKNCGAYVGHCGGLFEIDGHIYKAHVHTLPPRE